MAEIQANQANVAYWRRVVLQWVKCSTLIDIEEANNSIESICLSSTFDSFKDKITAIHRLEEGTVVEFLRVHFPDFELECNEFNAIPPRDNIYVLSLMLYFSCVRLPIPYFQNVCKDFDEQYQCSVKTFLNAFVADYRKHIRINRGFLDTAFATASSLTRVDTEEPYKLKDLNTSDSQILSSTPVHKQEMKRPSPHTPKVVTLEWKMKNLKTLLESARSENSTLEKQNEQMVKRIQQLNDDNQKYLLKIKAMQLTEQLYDCTSPVQKSQTHDRLNDLARKQLEEKDALIEMLQDEISKSKETVNMELERLSIVKMNNLQLKQDIQCLENSIETLNQELNKLNEINITQSDVINDLRRFIRENRLAYSEDLAEPLESSFECFDRFVGTSFADNSHSGDSENLAATVVEVKLKEQEKENERLVQEVEKQLLLIQKLRDAFNREKVENHAKISELQKSLDELDKSKKMLEIAYKNQMAEMQRESKDHKREQAEIEAQVSDLQHSLAEMDETKQQLEEALRQQQSSIKRQNENHKREQEEWNAKIIDLQASLADVVESNKQLEDALEKAMSEAKLQHEEHKHAQTEMRAKTVELQNSLDDIDAVRKQLQVTLEEERVKSRDLGVQLENQSKQHAEHQKRKEIEFNAQLLKIEGEKKQLVEALEEQETVAQQHEEEQKRALSDVNEKVVELQKLIVEANVSKEQLQRDLETKEATVEKLIEDHRNKQSEMNAKISELQRALDDMEDVKKLLQETVEKEVSKTQDINRQLKTQSMQHAEACKREKTEYDEKANELQRLLAESIVAKKQLEDALAKHELEVKQHLDDHKCTVLEMNEQISELKSTLDETNALRKHLQDSLEKETAKTEDLNRQLESLSKQHDEDRKREHVEANKKLIELEKSLAASNDAKKQLEISLEKQEAIVKQLSADNILKEAEMNGQIADLKHSLEELEATRKHLQDSLEKEITKTDVLNRQVESLSKQHDDDRKREQAEVNKKLIELEKSLAASNDAKKQLETSLEKQEAIVKQLSADNILKEAEMNGQIADLKHSLEELEATRKHLQDSLEKETAKTDVLNRQVESLSKQHADDRKREHAEANEKVIQLEKSLEEMTTSKLQLERALERQLAEVKVLQENRKCQQVATDAKTVELQKCLDRMNAEKQQLQRTLENELAHARDLNRQLKNLTKQHAEERARKEEMMEKSDELSSQYAAEKKRADDLDSQCVKLLLKVSAQETEISALKGNLVRAANEQGGWKEGAVALSELQRVVMEKESQLQLLARTHDEQQGAYEQACKDNEILCAKLYMARSELAAKGDAWVQERTALQEMLEKSKKACDEKVREARIEFEDKMERMKERMKDLHKEAKIKLEREREELLSTVEQSYTKRENLEARCAMLQKQVAQMNERDLQNRKENQLLQTKLKTMEEGKGDRKSLLLPPPAQARLRCNLKMEDEEGELFNNMYLADLQNGRCISPPPGDGGAERYSELMRRNSMRLPHLRTNYVALGLDALPADETRENVSTTTFDDSSTGLITRRKVSGITSYKRPGPPTPSKKAGRLSLSGALPGAGSDIQYKEALQDANVNAAGVESGGSGSGSRDMADPGRGVGRTKTPGKFKQMLSSSSLLSNFQRDEGRLVDDGDAATAPRAGNVPLAVAVAPIPTVRLGGALRHSKRVTQQLQRSCLFDSNRRCFPFDDGLLEALMVGQGETTVPSVGCADPPPMAELLRALVCPRTQPQGGASSSLYNIRRQQMHRSEQRHRQVDLRRTFDGYPQTPDTDRRCERTGVGGVARRFSLGTPLNTIAECSCVEEERAEADSRSSAAAVAITSDITGSLEGSGFGTPRTTNRICAGAKGQPGNGGRTHISSAGDNDPVSQRWNERNNLEGWQLFRRQQRHKLLDHQRTIGANASDGRTPPSAKRAPINPVTNGSSGYSCSVTMSETTKYTCYAGAQRFLYILIAVGVLAQLYLYLYRPHGAKLHVAAAPNAWCNQLGSTNNRTK